MAIIEQTHFRRRMARRKLQGQLFHGICLVAILIGLGMLAALLFDVISQGWSKVDWGFIKTSTEAHIRIAMSTRGAAGYRPPMHLFGHRLFRFCSDDSVGCSLIAPVPLDATTGYVNY